MGALKLTSLLKENNRKNVFFLFCTCLVTIGCSCKHQNTAVNYVGKGSEDSNMSSNNIQIISHRGAGGLEVENSKAAVNRAIKFESDYIEVDIHMTKDSHLVVIHDESIDRTTNGKGKIKDYTLSELKNYRLVNTELANAAIPTLQSVYDLCRGSNSKLVVEVKKPKKYPGILNELLMFIEKNNAFNEVVIISFDTDFISKIKKKSHGLVAGNLYVFPPKELPAVDIISINYYSTKLFKKRIKRFQNKGCVMWVWTVNSKSKIDKLIHLGVDGVTTDFPNILK